MREEKKKQEFKENRNKRKLKEQEQEQRKDQENQSKNLKELSELVQTLAKLLNDHMRSIQSEIEMIHKRIDINYQGSNYDKNRVNELEKRFNRKD